eukprot:g290.t1
MPLCDAAAEGRLEDMRHFLLDTQAAGTVDWQGRSPLALSASCNQLSCTVRLLEAGADAREALEDCERRHEELDVLPAALLTAMAGGKANQSALQLLLKRLDPPERNVAEAMLNRREPRGMNKTDLKEAMNQAFEEDTSRWVGEELVIEAPDSPEPPEPKRTEEGELYDAWAIWVRQVPDGKGQKLTKRMKQDRFRLLRFDETGNWGQLKVVLAEGDAEGWVMLTHPELGPLVRKCQDDDDRGGLLKPEEL